ncbi:MAG: hypothetical protein J1F18_15410, partial [Lachnospiraceae bacterium]|nr:hypothetical protein [Lachnospiraceae bacterium]
MKYPFFVINYKKIYLILLIFPKVWYDIINRCGDLSPQATENINYNTFQGGIPMSVNGVTGATN